MVGYHYDANHIQAIPIKNRKGQTITEAWEDLHNTFTKAEVAPQTYVLNNEKSRDLIDSFECAREPEVREQRADMIAPGNGAHDTASA